METQEDDAFVLSVGRLVQHSDRFEIKFVLFSPICPAWVVVGIVNKMYVELNRIGFQEVAARDGGEVLARAAAAV